MDDNTQILQQILNVLEKAVGNSASSGPSGPSAAQSSFDESLLTASQRAAKLSVEFEEQAKQIKSATKDVFGKFFTSVKESISPFGKYTDEIEKATKEYNTHIRTVSNVNRAEDKREKERLKSDLNRLKSEAVLNIATVGLKTNLQNLSQGALATFGTLKNMQDGAQGGEFQTAGELFKTSIGLMIDAVGAGASALGGLASGIPIIGGAFAALGQAIAAAGEATKKLVNAVTDIATKEITKTIDGFRDLSASGVMFADGMTGMRNAANASGLTIKQFSNVVKKSSDELAVSGLGVAKASTMIGGALTTGGGVLKTQLLNLGYDFEEQGGLVAETLRDMAGVSGPLKASNAQVAQQTAEYAENLRIISGITGEDAKKKMQEARDAANNLAFNQKLAGMDATQRQNVMAAMGNMSDLQKKSFMEMVTFGSVINKEGAMMMGSSQAFASGIQEFTTKFQGGALDAQSALDIQSKYGDQLRQDLLSNTDVAAAGLAGVGGAAENLATEMNKTLNFVQKYTKEAIEQATKGAQEQGKTEDPLTKQTNAVIDNMQNMKTVVSELITQSRVLTGLSKGAELMTQGLIQGAEELKKIIDSIEKGEVPGTEGVKVDKVGDALEGAASGAIAGAMFGAVGGPLAAAVGAALGGLTGAALGWFNSKEGNATGGIVSGPKDGYAVKVHGTELIVPLTESNKIKKDTEGLDLLKNMLKDDMSVISDSKNKSTNLSVPVTDFTNKINDSSSATIANKLTRNIPFEDKSKMQDLSGVADQLTDSFATSSRLQLNDISAITNQLTNEYSKNAKSKLVDENATDMRTPQPSIMNFSELVQKIESLEKVFNIQISKSSVTNDLLSEQSDYLRNILRASQ